MIKKQGQTLLVALSFLFSSCDKILPPAGNGVDIPVTIRAVSIAGGAQNEIVRAGGASRMVGEPIVQDLGGGMLAEITVEEDVETLRAKSLGTNVKFRVIAVDASNDKVYSYADYTVTVSNTITRITDPDLHVLVGGQYYFVCISYNNASLPAAPTLDANISTVSVTAGSNDLLWEKTTSKQISGALNLTFTGLKHQFAQVKFVFDVSAWGVTVSTINQSITLRVAATTRNFNLGTGAFASGSATTNPAFSWGTLNQATVTSNPLRVIPRTNPTTNYTVSVPANAITLSSSAKAPTTARTCTFPYGAFETGKSYTIRMAARNMQNFTTADCNAMAINEVVTLVDARDSKAYRIIKLKMGATLARCWMQQNLEIAGKTLTSADSNVASSFTLGALSGSNSTYAVTNPVSVASGYFYNWATAVAYSSAHYGGSDSRDITSGKASYSICPKGWRLPVGGEDTGVNDFALVDIYTFGGNGTNQLNNNALYNKWIDASYFAAVPNTVDGGGLNASFWTSLVVSTNANYAHALGLVDPGNCWVPGTAGKTGIRLSIRCIKAD
jgi:uncharacterized protein (TIGR02145 family)